MSSSQIMPLILILSAVCFVCELVRKLGKGLTPSISGGLGAVRCMSC